MGDRAGRVARPRLYLITVLCRFVSWTVACNAAFLCIWGLPGAADGCAVDSDLHKVPLAALATWLAAANAATVGSLALTLRHFWRATARSALTAQCTRLSTTFAAVGCGLAMGTLGTHWAALIFLLVCAVSYFQVTAEASRSSLRATVCGLAGRLMHFLDLSSNVGVAVGLSRSDPEGRIYLLVAVASCVAFAVALHAFPTASRGSSLMWLSLLLGKAMVIDLPLIVLDIVVLSKGDGAYGQSVLLLAVLSSLGELGAVGGTAVQARARHKSSKDIQAVITLAEGVALSLARYDLDDAEMRLRMFQGDSPGIIGAFRHQIANLASYRPFLPQYVLPVDDEEEESSLTRDSGTDNVPTTSGGHTEGLPTNTTGDRSDEDCGDFRQRSAVVLPVFTVDGNAVLTPGEENSVGPPPSAGMARLLVSGRTKRTGLLSASGKSGSMRFFRGSRDVQSLGMSCTLMSPTDMVHGTEWYLRRQSSTSGSSSTGNSGGDRPPPQPKRSINVGGMLHSGLATVMLLRMAMSAEGEPGTLGFIAAALDRVQQRNGMIVGVSYAGSDLCILAEWNGRRRCAMHPLTACLAAQDIVEAGLPQRRTTSGASADRDPLSPDVQQVVVPFPAGQASIHPDVWSLCVVSGTVTIRAVGNEQTRAQVLLGEPVMTARSLSLLAGQIKVAAVCNDRVYGKVRSDVTARIVDTVRDARGGTHMVYELLRKKQEGISKVYVQAFSEMCSCNWQAACELLVRYIKDDGYTDTQALRLLRIALMFDQQQQSGRERVAFVRTERTDVWESFEDQAEAIPLPAELEAFTRPNEGLARSVNTKAPTEAQEDEGAVLRRHFDDLVTSVTVRGTDLDSIPMTQGLPTTFVDERGRCFHRSSTCLGTGAYGKVWLAMGEDGEMVAVKSISLAGEKGLAAGTPGMVTETLSSAWSGSLDGTLTRRAADASSAQEEEEFKIASMQKLMKDLISEVTLMSSLKHHNVVQYLGCATAGNYALIVMEYLSGGNLQDLLRQFAGVLPTSCVRRLLADITRGLEFIHGNGIAHRDLKPANVLVTVEGQARIADFGASAQLAAVSVVTPGTAAGTPRYMAPEQALGRAITASDIWALGLMVCELHSGSVPYSESQLSLHPLAFATRLCRDPEFMPHIPQGIPADAQAMASLCLVRDPAQRPTAQMLLSHPHLLA
eukprot:TRINITY_DN27660_c0_g1_i1.p1 TRINITY_DN27660_c0_g1~~TRINITY_DN27660_c0_g1_i1.p1  ORF type:complete len:1178 (+),score=275.83 TRINITY_DN27660_c0_g1_i1:76-3609(+)